MKLKYIFFSLLFISATLYSASVNVTTYYGKTGGIVGKLNSTSDLVNGNEICSENPTPGCDFSDDPEYNNNNTVDDPHDDSYSGDLLIRTNDIFQIITGWNWNNPDKDGEDTVTLTGVLPETNGEHYYEWHELPGSCDNSLSSISEDKQTIICVRKEFDKDSVGTKSEDLFYNVRVRGGTPNGEKPGDISFKIESKNTTTVTDDTDNNSLTVTAAPRWNLQKSMYTAWAGKTDPDDSNVKGWIMDYKFYIESDEVSGETDSVNPIVGNESMGEDATFTFTDDMSKLPPNAKLIGCSMNGRYDQKDGYVGSSDPLTFNGDGSIYGDGVNSDRKIPQAKGVQQITCTQDKDQVAIKVEHVDATLNHYPIKDYAGRDIPVNRAIAAIGSIYVFIPVDDVKKGENGEDDNCTKGDDGCDDGQFATTNRLINFDPTTPSGNSNFGDAIESEKDNSYSRTLYYASGSWSKRYRGGGSTNYNGNDHLDYIYGWVGTGDRSGDGMVTKGAEFSTWIVTSNSGGTPFTEDTHCDVIDAYRLKIQPVKDNEKYKNIGNRYTGGADLPYRYYIWNDDGNYTDSKSSIPYIVEYATDYIDNSFLPSQGADTTILHKDDIKRECTDDSVKWTTDFEEAMKGPIGITKVRLRLKDDVEVPPGSGIYFWINHKIRDIDLATNQSMNNGDMIVNYAGHKFNYGDWYWPDYKPGIFPGNHSGWNGDRVMFTGPKVRIKKLVDRNTASPGVEVTYTLQTSYTDDIGSVGNTGNVRVVDVLPKEFHYLKGTTLPVEFGEPQEGNCADVSDLNEATCKDGENKVLIWDFGTREVNSPQIDDLNFTVQVGASAKVGVNINYAKIESPTDVSPITQRKSDATVSIDVPSTINIVKSTEDNPDYPIKRERTTEPKDIWFLMDMRNGTSNELTDLDAIDILPFIGDGDDKAIRFNNIQLSRKKPTSFHGTLKFNEASFAQHPASDSVCDASNIKYYYTNAEPKTINIAPSVGDENNVDDAKSIWCEGNEKGPNQCTIPSSGFTFKDNSEVTAVRVRGAKMEGQAVCQYRVKITVEDNLADDLYSNSTGASATGVTLPVLSNSIAVPIVGSSLGNFVWFDKNTNGVQDADEVGVAGVKVKLLDENGKAVKNPAKPNEDYRVVTDADGKYTFSKLNSGKYLIEFTIPTDYVTTERGNGDDSLDSDVDTSGRTELITLGVDSVDESWDMGIYKRASLGDTVWDDKNKNGIQDANEEGVAGIEVKLFKDCKGDAVAKRVTDSNGKYIFADMLPASYCVEFKNLPLGYEIISKSQGGDDTKDSDVNAYGKTDIFALDDGINNLNIDLGIYKDFPSTIGDTVWYDDNQDGIQDPTEFGVNGVKVTLYDGNNKIVKTTVTDKKGSYIFRDLEEGTYKVIFSDLPSGYKITKQDVTDEDKDSDANSLGEVKDINLTAGTNNLTIDMGIYSDKLSVIGDTVWYDDNRDGIQDDDELGVNGVKVTLYNGANVEATTVTDVGGSYIFRGVKNGTYTIGFSSLPSGYKITKKDAGSDDSKDSDVDIGTAKTDNIKVETASINLDSSDMGIYSDDPSIATLGDTVWYDDNQNGIQDPEELGVNGVKVSLYNKDGKVVKTTVTDSRGTYLFRNLIIGTYTVGFSSLPSGYKITKQGATSIDKDSDVDPDTAKTDKIEVIKGSDNLDVDMGIYSDGFLVSTIGDTVWYDDDKDGIQDENELGASGVKVTLYSGKTAIKSTVTDSRGTYLFRDIISGEYTIEFTNLPLGYKISPKSQGTDSAKDSDVDSSTGKTATIIVGSGSNNLDVDMGIYSDSDLISSIGDTVWYDDNKDGIQDSAELGAEAVKVTLYDSNDKVLKTTLTNAQGKYIFRDLLAGDYYLEFSSLPSGYKISKKDNEDGTEASDSDVDPKTAKTDKISLEKSTHYMDVDMGIYSDKLSTIGDSVWFDINKDGIQDSSELGVSGVKVTLYNGATVVQRAVTDDKGSYIFRNITNGEYRVEFSNLPSGYKISPKGATGDSLDSDANPKDGKTDTIKVTTSFNNLDVDMGIYSDELSSLGDTVWYDDNKDGIQDAQEQGAEGIKVILLRDGKELKSTVTDARGTYIFRDLLEGTYQVQFTNLPNSYKISPKDNGGTESTDSDVDTKTGITDEIKVTVGSNNLDVDMGIYSDKLSTLGDTVWYDDNKDGVQDPTERGVEGVKVTLFDSNSKIVRTTVTTDSGTYIFRDVPNGTYTIGFTNLPTTYKVSPKDATDDDKDSDVNKDGKTEEITVSVGTNNLDIDMGIYSDKLSTIGDSVWYDDNKDGIQDETEKGVEGVKVTLFNGAKVIKTTVTKKDGSYLFRDVLDGIYTLGFSNLPNGYKISPKDKTAEEKDSDVKADGKTDDIKVTVGSNNLDVDMGIYTDKLSMIGDTVWYDSNKNGIQDSTEVGVEGVKVTLYSGKDIINISTTNSEGNYIFRGVKNGTYTIKFTNLPISYKISPKGKSSTDKDSDVNADGTTDTITTTVGSINLDIDMGIYSDELSTIGNSVWYDDNKDGIQDATEKGVEGVKVVLYNSIDEIIATTVTDNKGVYLFNSVKNGTYYIVFSDLPSNYKISPKDATSDEKDSDVDQTSGKSDNFTVTVGTKKLNIDMGIYSDKLSTLGDTVWYDDNKDGVQDPTERGVEGVKVTLYNGSTVVKRVVTDRNGKYIFRDVVNGTYTLGFSDLPSNYKISKKDVGQDDRDSDVNQDGKTEEITVSVGTNNLTVDMGIYSDKLSTIGDSVWYDDNRDGVQNADEFGAEGIKVTLYSGSIPIQTTVTDRQGTYMFRDVLDGTYSVGFSNLPNGYKVSPKDASGDEKDSDIDVNTLKSDDINVSSGSNNLDIDMGIYSDKLSSLGDSVWYDDNKDGIQDDTEFGAEGIRVTLYNSSDKVVQTAVTDRRGTYIFRDIVEGTYSVGFSDLPNGYKVSPIDVGSDDKDSDIDVETLKSEKIKIDKSSTNLSVDMGIYSDKLSIIGDSVWYDDNRDGIQDETEFGAEGIKVTLYSGSKVVQTAVTNRRGTYIFRDIVEGTYTVEFSNLPNGYRISPKDIGSDDKDSDVNANGKSDAITVTRSSHNLGVDMGIYSDKLSIIGDSVWYDDNRDGIQDEHEFGAEGIKVVLYSGSKIVQTVVTDRRGTFIFRDIVEGTYQVGFSNLPNGYRVSPKDATTDDKDSDINVESGKTDNIVVTRSSHNLDIDMGIYSNKLSVIGDSVWYDDNKNGIQDETEKGAEGIKVTLYSGTKIVNTVVTDRRGTYIFRDVLEGTYTLGFSDLPSGYKISPKNAGEKDKDSDVNVKTAKSDSFVVTVGTVNLNIDMGIYSNKLSNIGDSVWYDNNRNGIQESFETGVEGVKVALYSSNGKIVQTTVTDERGVYTFRGVINGTYRVGFSDLPTGFKISPKDVGDDAFDSDVDVKTGKSDTITVSEGTNNLTVDMGIYTDTLASIGNSVWYDDNRNGVQDSAEKGVESVKVTLYTKDGRAVDVTTTDSLGVYHFYRIVPNSYYLVFSDLPVGYKITAQDVGNNEKDSDANILTGQTVVTKLEAGENDLSWDMGIYNTKRATLGDTVWYDDNKNGLQDSYERGVGSVKVTLYTDSDIEIDSTVTDNKGNYKFSSLVPANYYMVFSDLPISYEATVKDAGADSKDSDVDPKTLRTDTTTLIAGENDLSWDMGIYDNKGASIGDTVWYDDNANGIQDAYELGAEDVLVRLYTKDGRKIDTVITDDKGGYSFRNLVPGAYFVEFAHLPVGYEVSPKDVGDNAQDSDVDASTLRTDVITVGIGQNMMDLDLGIFNKQKGTLGDLVWFDTNHNGLQDRDEKGVNGIKVTLFNAKEEVVATKVTSETGQYLFRNLVAGDYFLEFSEFPLGYMITKQNVKDEFLSDSDANYHRGQTEVTTLEAGENDLSWDLGIYTPKLASIGDKVWLDDNRDGIQNSNEKGIAGVKVTLVKNDIPQTPEEQTTTSTKSVITDENGNYIFKNIEVGEPHRYHLIFDDSTIFDDYQFSISNQGNNDNLDSDIDPKTKKSKVFILESDTMSIDAGVEGFAVNDDSVEANPDSSVTTISLLSNDSGNINKDTILFVDAKDGKILYDNGTAVGGATLNTTQTYVVKGEGVWQVEADGTVTFTAEKGFRGVPTPVYYIVQGVSGKNSNIAKITISTPCATYKTSSSVSTLSYASMLLILLVIPILGLLFSRREFEEK